MGRTLMRPLGLVLVVFAVAWAPLRAQESNSRRVASLVPAATEALFAIGAGDLVVGVGDYDDFPEAVHELPRIGGLIDPNLEAILALRPDLVIIDPSQRTLATQLDAAGISTYSFKTGSIGELLHDVRTLGNVVGVPGAEAVAAEVEQVVNEVRAAVAGQPTVTALAVFGRRPGAFAELWVSGGVGFLHDVVDISGGENVFSEIGQQSFKSGLEAVLARRPQVVIEATSPDANPDAVTAEWRALPGFSEVRVVVLDASWSLRPSPRVVRLLWQVAEGLHPSLER